MPKTYKIKKPTKERNIDKDKVENGKKMTEYRMIQIQKGVEDERTVIGQNQKNQ